LTADAVYFDNARQDRLAGTLHNGVQRNMVITCHGLFSNKDTPKHVFLAECLALHPVGTLRFDFAGCGASGGRLFDTSYSQRMQDLDAAITYVCRNGAERVAVFGSSLGGAVALLCAARDERIVAVATLGAVAHPAELLERHPSACDEFARLGYADLPQGRLGPEFYYDSMAHEVVAAVGVLYAPLFVVHGLEDQVVPCSDAHDIAAAARNASLELVDGADHAFSQVVHMRPAMMRVATFLASHLG
jgi:pimeloyl-ACP methyl ester carboxylesterase